MLQISRDSNGLTGPSTVETVARCSPMAMGMVSPKPLKSVFIQGAAAGKPFVETIGGFRGTVFVAVYPKRDISVHLLTVCIMNIALGGVLWL